MWFMKYALFITCVVAGCAVMENSSAMEIKSTAFERGAQLPVRYTADGEDISPPLDWIMAPPGTKSFLITMEDPDAPAGTWVHWVIYNIPPDVSALAEGIPKEAVLLDGSSQCLNGYGEIGYDGPSPPAGTAHRYVFTICALDIMLETDPGGDRGIILVEMTGHVLTTAQLIGSYQS